MNAKEDLKHFGLIGFPLYRSRSPRLHEKIMKQTDTKGDYTLVRLSDGEAEDGFNITIPYKTSIIPFLDTLSERAALYGAVNTVKVNDSKAWGYNTDGIGFLKAIESAGISLCGRVLILGCGGVARVFAFESALAHCDITLGIRASSTDKAYRLKREIKEKTGNDISVRLTREISEGFDLIINATPVGMVPDVDSCPIGEEVIKQAGAVFDAIYKPLKTVFIRTAEKHGIRAENGLKMLVWQAVAAQEIWCEKSVDEGTVSRIIKELESEDE